MKRETMLPSACVAVPLSASKVSFCKAKEWLSSRGLCFCETIGTHVWLFGLLIPTVAKLPETWNPSVSVSHMTIRIGALRCTNVSDTGKNVVKLPVNIALFVSYSCRCHGGLSIHDSVETTQLRWLVTSQIFLMYDNMTKGDFHNVAITSGSYNALVA